MRYLAALLMFSGLGCGPEPESKLNVFFENSTRRDATPREKTWVARTPKGCTAFFIRNSKGKTILGSARHCFDFRITDWCESGPPLIDHFGREGYCKSIIAADSKHDFAIFEADFPYQPSPDDTLTLTTFDLSVGMSLSMVGYPADKFRNGRLTVTESCWIMKPDKVSPHGNMHDRSALHNCTTYGGNSGGPMLISGTQLVVGLPFTYAPGDYRLRSSTNLGTAGHMAKTKDLLETYPFKIRAAGIVTIE